MDRVRQLRKVATTRFTMGVYGKCGNGRAAGRAGVNDYLTITDPFVRMLIAHAMKKIRDGEEGRADHALCDRCRLVSDRRDHPTRPRCSLT